MPAEFNRFAERRKQYVAGHYFGGHIFALSASIALDTALHDVLML